jgi:hypothetical protein
VSPCLTPERIENIDGVGGVNSHHFPPLLIHCQKPLPTMMKATLSIGPEH